MSILAIIVTYGNRFNYLNQVLKRLLKEKIKKILVISNGSEEISKKLIFDFKKKNKKIKLLILKKKLWISFCYKKRPKIFFKK